MTIIRDMLSQVEYVKRISNIGEFQWNELSCQDRVSQVHSKSSYSDLNEITRDGIPLSIRLGLQSSSLPYRR